MSEKPPILIATNSHDEATVTPVVAELNQSGYEALVYEADRVATGEVALSIAVSQSNGLTIAYDHEPFYPMQFGAAWLRKPSNFNVQKAHEDRATRLSIDRERRAAQAILWDSIPDERWLNAPRATIDAQEKIGQLVLARELGFTIPDTIVSNSWPAITDALPGGNIAFKTFGGVLHSTTSTKAAFTKHFAHEENLPQNAMPFPGILQRSIGKKREWRVTVVGDDVFPVAIYTDESAKDDWRLHQQTAAVSFRTEPFPDDLRQRCQSFLARCSLRYGAFDFIEDDERIVFLEVNPAGQYQWLEDELGLPISRAISRELIAIAKSHA